MYAPEGGAIRRSLRRFTLGSGPLKRRSDRLQVIGRFLVVLSFLASPPIAVAVANSATAQLREVAAAEAASRSQTVAVLLEEAGPAGPGPGDAGAVADQPVPVKAAWTLPDGSSREGIVVVPPGTAVGSAVDIWVDRDGDATRAPRDPAGIPGTAAALAVLPLIGVPVAGWFLYAVLCFALDAHRHRRWDEDWTVVEPDWHSRLL
jgi:hypothetical protein